MENFKILSKNELESIHGGSIPSGWTKTELPNGNTRYDGPNGSWMIVHRN